jgi:integrase
MAENGNGPRTQANRVNYIKCFFNGFGLKAPLLKTDKIRYTQKGVTAYSTEELKALFAAANQEELELFQFFLCTGRDGEVQHACWSDINFARKTFKWLSVSTWRHLAFARYAGAAGASSDLYVSNSPRSAPFGTLHPKVIHSSCGLLSTNALAEMQRHTVFAYRTLANPD